MVADIVDSRLETAKKMGADVTINCGNEDLKERGKGYIVYKKSVVLWRSVTGK